MADMGAHRPIRTAIVGVGRAGWGMQCTELARRTDAFEIIAACDTYEPWRLRFAERYPDARVTDDIDGIIGNPDVELVSIATRSVDHYDHAMRALRAGKVVFLEKPMCTTHAEAQKLREISERGPGRLYVRHNRRFEPGFQTVRSIIDSGILGEVVHIKLARTSFGRRNDWQTLLQFGGGQLSNWGSHIIDHALQFLGAPASPLQSIHAILHRIAAVGDAEDHVKIVLTGASGTIADIEVSGGAATPSHEYVIWGTRGGLYGSGNRLMLRYLDPSVELAERVPFAGVPGSEFTQPSGVLGLGSRTIGSNFGQAEELSWVEEERSVPAGDPSVIWDHLHVSIREGVPFPVTLEEAVAVMRIIDTARLGSPFVQTGAAVGKQGLGERP